MISTPEREQAKVIPLRIFLVSCSEKDEQIIRNVIEGACADHHVETIEDSATLDFRLSTESPDLLLACTAGRTMTGWDALQIASERSPRTPVILFSSDPTEKEAMKAIDLGAADFVQLDRPWEVTVAVRRTLREYEQRQRRREAEDRLRNHINLLQLQQVVATAANEALSNDDAAQSVLDVSRAYGGFSLAHIFYAPDEDSARLRTSEIWSGYDETRHKGFRSQTEAFVTNGRSVMPSEVFKKGELVWIPDISAEPRFFRAAAAAAAGLRCVVMAPISVGSEILGVIEYLSAAPIPRDERMALVLEYVATELGRVIERNRSERRLENRAREQMVLAELSRKVVDVVNLDEFLQNAARRVEDILPDCHCLILETEPGAKSLRVRAQCGDLDAKKLDLNIPTDQDDQIGSAMLNRDLMKIDLGAKSPWKGTDQLHREMETAISASIRLRHQVFGTIIAYSPGKRDFSRSDGTFLRGVANVLATAVEHSAAFHQLQLLSSAVTQSQDAIVITDSVLDPTGPRITFVNPAFTQILGYRGDEVLGQSPRMFHAGRDAEPKVDSLLGRLREGKSSKVENLLRRKDGSEIWAETLISPLRSASGDITHFVGIHRDITERKIAEQRLRDSEEMLGTAQRVAHLGGWYLEFAGSELMNFNLAWTDEVFRIFGYEPQAVAVTNELFFRCVHPDDRAKVQKAFEDAIQGRREYRIDHRIIRPDGTVRVVHEQANPVYDETGRPTRVTGTVQDITERKHAEEEMQHWKERYDMLTKASGQIIFEWDCKTGRRTSGGDIKRLLGCPMEALGDSIEDWIARIHPEDQTFYEREIDRQFATKSTMEIEYRVRRQDGTYITVKGVGYPLIDENGALTRIVGSITDISSQRALEGQLRRSQKMEAFGKLAGGVAHDFNNLLTIITGYNEVLLSEMPAGDPNREYIEEIAQAANRARALTAQLLAFSRQQKLQPRVVNLNTAIRDTSKMISRLIGEDISMQTVEAEDLGNVKADVGQIEQVVMNLAVNARDAMPGGGTITMSTRNVTVTEGPGAPANVPPGEYILLEVSDTGTGMSPDVQARIFEPFFTTKAQGHGTGLGLATCYGIVKQSGGEIAVQSKIGVGTTFQIFLPRVYEECTPVCLAPAPGLLPTGNQTILVVEDEMPVRGIIRSILQRLKYTVLEASNGAEALQLLDTPDGKNVDLLMSDIVMPEMGGKELVKRLVDSRPNLRVIMISGYPITPSEELPPGTQFLAKPFTPKALAEAVHEAFTFHAA